MTVFKKHTPEAAAGNPGAAWNELARIDTNPVPKFLIDDSYSDLGSEPIPVSRYTDSAFFREEVEKMWPNVWQFAAREEELTEPGATVVYENVGRSYLVVRQNDGSVRAFHNVCLHRGRKLRTESGTVGQFRCPFHGFTWNTNGALKEIPCRWDFKHLDGKDMSLPEAQVGRWGGYIFVKENPGGPTLEEFLAPLPEHFRRWPQEERYTAAWVAKVVKANWKATAEAFMEAFHVIATHPQIMAFSGDTITKYYTWGDNVNLAITPFGVTSSHLPGEHDQQWVIDNFIKYNGRVAAGLGKIEVGEGETARQTMGRVNRGRFGYLFGQDLSTVSDAEVQDAFTYNVFPNFSPWGGFAPNLVYRWRPWPDQDHTLMEVRILHRVPPGTKAPACAPMKFFGPDEPWTAAEEFGALGAVLQQDMGNLPYVQEGLKASKNGVIQLGSYQEVRVRHFHQTLDKYLSGSPGSKA
jgi:phenylpropionate dioxygenase-like ring-hydroxylating dioxygenase large terminal subunit